MLSCRRLLHLVRVLSEVLYCGLLEFSDMQFDVTFSHRKPLRGKMLGSFQWAPSDHSRDYFSGTIASFSWYSDLFWRFLAPQKPFPASWSHHQTPAIFLLVTICPNSRTQSGINTAMVSGLEEGGAIICPNTDTTFSSLGERNWIVWHILHHRSPLWNPRWWFG